MSTKTLDNTTVNQAKDQVSDLKIWGNGDTFKLICKASSKKEGWMKSTKAMEIEGVGCVVQVTTQQRNETAVSPWKKDAIGELDLNQNGDSELDFSREADQYSIAEALTFVPNVKIQEIKGEDGKVTERKLIKI